MNSGLRRIWFIRIVTVFKLGRSFYWAWLMVDTVAMNRWVSSINIYIYIYKPVRKDMSGSSCITARVGTAIYIAAWIPGSRPLVIAKHYVLVLAGWAPSEAPWVHIGIFRIRCKLHISMCWGKCVCYLIVYVLIWIVAKCFVLALCLML